MYTENRIGGSILPWGTPASMGWIEDKELCRETWKKSVRYVSCKEQPNVQFFFVYSESQMLGFSNFSLRPTPRPICM